jgi:hypothetical protein
MTLHLSGSTFGKLKVLEISERRKRKGRWTTYWNCLCECGRSTTVSTNDLRTGNTSSCGCGHKSVNLKHGESKTRLYRTWCGIKKRCLNPNEEGYKNYGGRGITLFKEWNDSFEPFRDWALANGYKDTLTIERINVDGNYEPSNCTFIKNEEQSFNRRTTRYETAWGETKALCAWAKDPRCLVSSHALWLRIERYGWNFEKALTTPI